MYQSGAEGLRNITSDVCHNRHCTCPGLNWATPKHLSLKVTCKLAICSKIRPNISRTMFCNLLYESQLQRSTRHVQNDSKTYYDIFYWMFTVHFHTNVSNVGWLEYIINIRKVHSLEVITYIIMIYFSLFLSKMAENNLWTFAVVIQPAV